MALNYLQRNVFFMKKVKYVGHIVSKDGVEPDPDNLTADLFTSTDCPYFLRIWA